jgi:hypothetical protein
MSANRQEQEIRAAERDLERQSDEMEQRLDELGEDIEEAHGKATAHPDIDDNAVAGDWDDESAGAQQGDDAEDTEDQHPPSEA